MNQVENRLETVAETVSRALAEDFAQEDASSLAVVPVDAQAKAVVLARAEGILAGRAYAQEALHQCHPGIRQVWSAQDGDRVQPNQEVLRCEGPARALLAAERTLLNFLQQLSGVATATAEAVARAGSLALLDTRKTTPGLRDAQKAAVVAGGGVNHRRDLADQLLLKENHFALSGLSYAQTVAKAREACGDKILGAEAQTIEEARQALGAGANYVLLDNFSSKELPKVVQALREEFPQAILEASGGITWDTLPAFAASGVDRVSMGALTHSVTALDLSLLLEPSA